MEQLQLPMSLPARQLKSKGSQFSEVTPPTPQGEQLPMYLPAQQVRERAGFHDYDREETWDDETGEPGPEETHSQAWERKSNEAWDYGIAQEIQKEGIHIPVRLHPNRGMTATSTEVDPRTGTTYPWAVSNGHHRIAAALDIDPTLETPLQHHMNFAEAHKGHEHSMYSSQYPSAREVAQSQEGRWEIRRQSKGRLAWDK
jgi:hypothetical protein